MFTLAHLSDIHLPPLPKPRRRDLINKRLLGYINWHRNRVFVHRRAVLDTLIADLKHQSADHIAVTGDLTNLGLPQEYEAAQRWIQTLGDPETVTVIPGNHDAYVRLWTDPGWERWRAYMTSGGGAHPPLLPGADPFPFIKTYGEVALIGLSSAIKTTVFFANGRLGAKQRLALADTLEALGKKGLFRVVLIHHPPLPGQTPWRRALRDAGALKAILKTCGAELVLYGHNHQWTTDSLEGPHTPISIIQAPSASQGKGGKYPLAGYNLFSIQKDAQGWQVEHIRRGLTSPDGPVTEISKDAIGYR